MPSTGQYSGESTPKASGPYFSLVSSQLGGDGVQGFIPGDPLESAFTFGPRSLEWVLQTVGRVDVLGSREGLGAE